MKNRRRPLRLLALVILCSCLSSFWGARAQDTGSSQLLVKLDGKTLRGFQDLMSHAKSASPPLSQKQADEVITANTVKLRRGKTAKLSVFLVQANGDLKDITLDPNLHVSCTLNQVQFSRGQLLAEPPPGWQDIHPAGPADLFVSFSASGDEKAGPWDEFTLDISE